MTAATPDVAERLWSVHEIEQLVHRFALAHDSRDLAAMEQLFVPADAPLEWPSFNVVNALKRLPEYFAFAGPTMLFTANHIIELDGQDDAHGSVYCQAKLDLAGTWVEQALFYDDVYARHDGRWRFVSRRHLLWYGVELPERPFDQPKTQWPVNATGRGSLPEDFPSWRRHYGIAAPPSGFYAQP
jgi:hypothetical protein